MHIWVELQNWIEDSYPEVFDPDWLYGGKNRGWSLRYEKARAFWRLGARIPPVFDCGGPGIPASVSA